MKTKQEELMMMSYADVSPFARKESVWPLGNILPVKRDRKENWPELGWLKAGLGPAVHIGIIYCPPERLVEYESYEALYNDGWRVD